MVHALRGGVVMTYEEIKKIWKEKKGMAIMDFFSDVKIKMQNDPMIVLANLSKNTYVMMNNDGFCCNEINASGRYDDLIDEHMESVHPNYQRIFYECFSREQLIRRFQQGRTEVYAEIYQKNKQSEYQWVSEYVVRLESTSGDVTHICFASALDNNGRGYWQK